jgi:putative ABC transport system substrate-binding protein
VNLWRGLIPFALTSLLFAFESVDAQQTSRIPRIGYLGAVPLSSSQGRKEAFRQGLHDLGYTEGKNILIEWRSSDGKVERLGAIADELVGLKVNIIVTSAPIATRHAMAVTKTIPIVMANDADPVGTGVVESLSRPGGNVTGLSTLSPEISGKQLELMREIIPRLARVALVATSTLPVHRQMLKETELAARVFGIKLQFLDVSSAGDIEHAFRAASDGRADALLVRGGPVLNSHRKQIVDLALKNRLPAMHTTVAFVEDGGLLTYTVSQNDLSRRAATYVHKILKGAKPADLPVEQPTKFELVINLKAAKQIGITIPQKVLARADRVIR